MQLDSQLENSLAYYQRRLEETENKPELHGHLRLLYEKYLSLLEEYPDQVARFTMNVLPVIKAEKCDRHRAFMRLYRKLGHEEGEAAHRKLLEVFKGVNDFKALKVANLKESLSVTDSHDHKRRVLFSLCCQLINYLKGSSAEKKALKKGICDTWQSLKDLDREMSWERVTNYQPYRYCLYYDDERLEILGQTLKEVLK